MRSSCGRRRDCEDAASATLLHARQEALYGEERGSQTSVDGRVPVFLRYFLEGPGHRTPSSSVRDEYVYRAELLFYSLSHGLDIGEAGDIAGHVKHFPAVTLDLGPYR